MYHIIANETHLTDKHAGRLEEVKAVFDRAGKEYQIYYTKHKDDAKKITESITSEEGEHVIVAIGGDGTLHDVINGIKNFENTSVGLIPVGTGNDFAESAGIPLSPRRAAEIIAFRAPESIDFIELSSGLRSINAVGMGIDVDVLKRTYAGKGKGRSKYLRALIKSLIHFKSYDFTLTYDGIEEKHHGLIAALGNGRQIGGGIKLFPEAKINDGMLDMLIVDYISKPKIIAAFIKLMRGKINEIKNAKPIRVKEVSMQPDQEHYTIQAEGELYDDTPIDAHIVTDKLKFYLPHND